MSDCGVRVICRFRPINKREISEGLDPEAVKKILLFPDPFTVELKPWNNRSGQMFSFDRVFSRPETTQEEVYELAARDSIDNLLKGFNATIFAYGQTGAGKSFTMFGPDISTPSDRGIIPRACNHIFRHISEDQDGTEYTIKCSFLEIYKELVNDLLNPRKRGLKVRETPSRGVWVDGLTEEYVTCEQDVYDLIKLGEKSRAVASTNMNATSSRSHSLFILKLHQKSTDGSTKEGKLNLADLAGSEKVGKTGASGDTLEEAKKINQSLSALGNCINALTSGKKGHIPYRDSKLTFILRESLGGNCKTTLVIACSPHIFNLEETISTLMFGKRAKTIKNKVKVNKQRSVAELMAIIERLKKELSYFKRYVKALEKALEESIPKEEPPSSSGKSSGDGIAPSPSEPALSSLSGASTSGSSTSSEVMASEISESTGGSRTPRGAGRSTDNSLAPPGGAGAHARSRSDGNGAISSASTPTLQLAGVTSSPPGSVVSSPRLGEEFNADASEALVELQLEMTKVKERHMLAMDEMREDISTMKEEKETAEAKAAIAEKQMVAAQAELKQAKAKLLSEQGEMDTLKKKLEFEHSEMELEVETKSKQLEDERDISKRLKAKVAQLQGQESVLQSSLETLEAKHRQLERDLSEHAAEAEAAQATARAAKEELNSLQEQHEQLSADHIELSTKHKRIVQQHTEAEEKVKELSASVKDASSQLRLKLQVEKELMSRLDDAKGTIRSLQTDLEDVRSQLEKAELMHGEIKQEGEKELEQLKQETVSVAAWEKTSAELKQARLEANEASSAMQDMKYKLESEAEEVASMHKSELEQLEEDHKKALATLQEEKEEQLAAFSVKEQKLLKKVTESEMQVEALEKAVKGEREERRKLQSEYDGVAQQLNEREHQIGVLADSLHDRDRELSALEKTSELHEKSVTHQKQRIEHLEAEYARVKEEKEQLLIDLETALTANMENAKRFEAQLEKAQTRIQRQEEAAQERRSSNIKVPVRQAQRSPWQILFGIKTLPLLSEISEPVKYGFLQKRSAWLRRWDKRWVMMTEGSVFYFESFNQATRANGEIELDGCKVADADTETGKKNTFGIYHPTRRDVFFQASSSEERIEWISALQSMLTVQTNPVGKLEFK